MKKRNREEIEKEENDKERKEDQNEASQNRARDIDGETAQKEDRLVH